MKTIIIFFLGVTIVSNPPGTPVDDQPSTFDYPILSSVTLTCMIVSNGEILTGDAVYKWDTTECYTNTAYNDGIPKCFPHGQTTQTVIGNDLTAEDAGTIYCAITIGDVHYTSSLMTIRISGMPLVTLCANFWVSLC